MADVTILHSNKDLAKRHSFGADGWTTTPFSDPREFGTVTMPVENITDLHDLLTAIEADPRRCIVHGQLKDGMPSRGRRIMHDQQDGDIARFDHRDVTHWLCLDIDKMPCPADLQIGNDRAVLADRLAHVCRELPADFRNVSFSYAWSASAGVRSWETLSVHLWFWIATPLPLAQIKARAEAEAWSCDRSLMSPVQIHYTAAPVFTGADDPLAGNRSGFIAMDHDAVTLSAWTMPVREQRSAGAKLAGIVRRERPSVSGDGSTFVSTADLDRMLNQISDDHLHGPITRAIGHYVAMTPADERDDAGLRAEIVARVKAAKGSGITARSAQNFDEHCDDAYLDRAFDGADFKYEAIPDVVRMALAKKVLRNWNKKKATKNRRLQ